MAARRPSVLPMDLSSLLDSFTPEARPVRRASVMLTEQICHSINTLAPAVSVEQRGLIDQISTQVMETHPPTPLHTPSTSSSPPPPGANP
mmetsp:Transcript_28199/g.84385  ORF Transcript_28199/g.84385 Transcript_28199/m.84385 type:complete len:90 (+) Transcript_28199:247-516(+)